MFNLDALLAAGFKKALTLKEYEDRKAELAAAGMNRGGSYNSDYILKRGAVTITHEQNTSTLASGGQEITTRHLPVVVVEGPKGKVAIAVDDIDSILYHAEMLA
jgi:hypothetical protein